MADLSHLRKPRGSVVTAMVATAVGVLGVCCLEPGRASAQMPPGPPPDEAKLAGRDAFYFHPRPEQIHDYFPEMDVISTPAAGTPADAYPDQLLDRHRRLHVAGPHPSQWTLRPYRDKRDVVPPRLTPDEALGRNTWMLWCGGNEAFWDWLTTNSHGFLDLLKVVDSRRRPVRWRDAGMVNEPGMREVLAPDQFGLWLDEPEDPDQARYRQEVIASAFDASGCCGGGAAPPGYPPAISTTTAATGPAGYAATMSYAAASGYPPTTTTITTGPRTRLAQPPNAFDAVGYSGKIPPAPVYGLSTGVIGLRLFPNPRFDAAARAKWDGERYYDDPSYYNDPNLVRPYRVGMSCAFCHVSAHPLNPPLDAARPRWENISGNIGSQYLRMRAVFGNLLTPDNFVYHVLDSQPPGTIDTSLIASDNINNTNTMNAIFGVPQRVVRSFDNPREKVSAAAAGMPSIYRDPAAEAPQAFKNLLGQKLLESNAEFRYVPRVLFDGADSIGVYGALARVYLNIGTYHQQWIRLHEPLIGFLPPDAAPEPCKEAGRTQLPFRIEDCQENSVYWQATLLRVGPLRDYFLRITPTMPLLDARGGGDPAARVDVGKLERGRRVFARNCIVCHSSIQPESIAAGFLEGGDVADYEKRHADVIQRRREAIKQWEDSGEVWDHDPGRWLRDPAYQSWASDVVERPGFWRQNFLSSDFRVPVNYIGTNSARAMATNATNGHMWQDFSSDTYRSLPSVGAIAYFNPFTRRDELFTPRHGVSGGAPPGGGGPGFYRPASLMSVWATAPLLHNNSLGHFNNDPSVNGRLAAFDDAIHKLLYPERRLQSSDYAPPAQLARDHGLIWRTPTESYLRVRGTDVPLFLRRFPLPHRLLAWSESLTEMGKWRAALPAGLLLLAFAILLFARGRRWTAWWWRIGAYGLVVVALLVGFLAYLDTGGLGDLRIGPIPAGTPVNLLANLNPDAPPDKLRTAVRDTVDGLTEIQTRRLEGAERDRVFRDKIAPALMDVNKCPDFVMDKGHYFPWFADMTPEDKEALIELLKTF